jgi:hypothetical protein
MSFDLPATSDEIQETIRAVTARGLKAEVLETGQDALARIRELIPTGSTISTGASLTLREIGLEDLLKAGTHAWKNLKGEYLAEQDPARRSLLMRQSILADYFLGSVHAVSRTGEIVVASMTGSQIAPYAFAARNLIWVVGAQKITSSLEEGVRRLREYVLPHENARMLESSGGKRGSRIGKLMIFEYEVPFLGRNVTLLFVKQKLGD